MDANNIKIADLPFELENATITGIIKGAPSYLAPPALMRVIMRQRLISCA